MTLFHIGHRIRRIFCGIADFFFSVITWGDRTILKHLLPPTAYRLPTGLPGFLCCAPKLRWQCNGLQTRERAPPPTATAIAGPRSCRGKSHESGGDCRVCHHQRLRVLAGCLCTVCASTSRRLHFDLDPAAACRYQPPPALRSRSSQG